MHRGNSYQRERGKRRSRGQDNGHWVGHLHWNREEFLYNIWGLFSLRHSLISSLYIFSGSVINSPFVRFYLLLSLHSHRSTSEKAASFFAFCLAPGQTHPLIPSHLHPAQQPTPQSPTPPSQETTSEKPNPQPQKQDVYSNTHPRKRPAYPRPAAVAAAPPS